MRLRKAAIFSLRALLAHRVRTALALAGVAVGIAGVLLTSAVGKGAEAELMRGIEAGNLMVVRPAPIQRSAARKELSGLVRTLRLDDFHAIAALPLTADAAPGVDGALRARAGSGSARASVLGTGPGLVRVRRLRLAGGRFFDEDDELAARRVAVLGARLARTLYGQAQAVGEQLRLRGVPFEVIGVLEPKGMQADGSDQDGTIFIPARTALRRVFNTTWLTAVFVSVEDRESLPQAEAELRELLRERHRLAPGTPDDFAIQDQVKLLAMQQATIASLTWLTAALAAVSLLVGGAGILALMLLSVKERTGEIGLRTALGARPLDILIQFLGEATLLAVGGWLAGAATALAGAWAVALATQWKLGLPAGAALASFLMAVLTGVGFGLLPARRAARLAPIVALGSS